MGNIFEGTTIERIFNPRIKDTVFHRWFTYPNFIALFEEQEKLASELTDEEVNELKRIYRWSLLQDALKEETLDPKILHERMKGVRPQMHILAREYMMESRPAMKETIQNLYESSLKRPEQTFEEVWGGLMEKERLFESFKTDNRHIQLVCDAIEEPHPKFPPSLNQRINRPLAETIYAATRTSGLIDKKVNRIDWMIAGLWIGFCSYVVWAQYSENSMRRYVCDFDPEAISDLDIPGINIRKYEPVTEQTMS